MKIKWLFFTLLLLNVIDGVVTLMGVKHISDEGNPLVRYVASYIGIFNAIILFKVTAIIILCWAITLLKRLEVIGKLVWCSAILVNIFYLISNASWVYFIVK